MAGGPRSRVTIRDVATDAGLSISTVSRVLSGARAVSPDIARTAQESAQRLGYRVDSIGRSLRTQRTQTVGLVVPDIMNPFFPALVQAIERAARVRGLGLLIANADNDPDVERAALRTLVDRRVDAILISPIDRTVSRDALTETAQLVTTVQVDRVADETLPFVRVDQSTPIETLLRHLHVSGRRHVAFIGQETSVATSLERERAFVRLAAERFPGEPLRVLPGGMSAESGRAGAQKMLRLWPETDAVVCANDLIALGVLREIAQHPPGNRVAVSGFDDTLIAQAVGLTSVRQPVDAIAHAAIGMTDHADLESPETGMSLNSSVVFRQSTR